MELKAYDFLWLSNVDLEFHEDHALPRKSEKVYNPTLLSLFILAG